MPARRARVFNFGSYCKIVPNLPEPTLLSLVARDPDA